MVDERPQCLFMLNQNGQTPLDICIEEDLMSQLVVATHEDIESQGNAGDPTEEDEEAELARGKYLGSSFIRNVAKVIDEDDAENRRKKSPKELKMLEWIEKTMQVMSQMQKYS